jgi:CheY-like chemotaxis protein
MMSGTPSNRILLVEDEPALLDLLDRFLGRLGYEVEPCRNSEGAWESYSAQPEAYALVLTDLTLPGMSGEEMARRILNLCPDARVLLCSGYPFDVGVFGNSASRVAFLQKPFVPKMLEKCIRQLIPAPEPT